MPPIQPLSLDLHENVIQFLDEGEIKNLSPSCRALVSFCQKSFFRTVILVQEKDWSLEDDAIQTHPIESFHRHLALYPHLGSHVRVLEIGCMMNYDKGEAFAVLAMLPQVRMLTFGFSDGNRQPEPEAGELRSWLKTSNEMKTRLNDFLNSNPISSLSLFGIEHLPHNFIAQCRHLQSLCVLNVQVLPRKGPCLQPAIELRDLEVLHDSLSLSPTLVTSFAPTINLEFLTKLSIDSARGDPDETEDKAIHLVLGIPVKLRALHLDLKSEFRHSPFEAQREWV